MTRKDDPALDLIAGLVLADGRRWGDVAAKFQWEDVRAILDPEADAPYHYLTRSRGASKTSDLAAIAIGMMLAQLPPGSRLYALASDRDQARLLLDAIAGFAVRTPTVGGALTVGTNRVTAARRGTTLDVLAADAPGAWGLRPDFVVVDELAQWPETRAARELWEAAATAVAKSSSARLVVLTTAGDPTHWAGKVLEHAKADPLWRVHEVPGPAPWLDRERVEEQRRRLTPSAFARLFLNVWTAARDRLVTDADLGACVVLAGPLAPKAGTRYIVAVDAGLTNDATVAVVAHSELIMRQVDRATTETVGTRVILDRIETWQGSSARPVQLDDVEQWLAQAARDYNRAQIRLDPWQTIGLAQRLRSRGYTVEEFVFSQTSVGRIASTLHLLLRNRALSLPDDEQLLDELRHVRLRESSPGIVRMDHDNDRHDDRAVALGLACDYLLTQRTSNPRAHAQVTTDGESLSDDLGASHTWNDTAPLVGAFDDDF